MPTFLTEPQWYDKNGDLVTIDTFNAEKAKSLQAVSGNIFGDVPLRGNTTDAQGKPSQLPENRQASPTPIYILPKITAVQNDAYFPESDHQFFYAMILNYIALNCQTTVDEKAKIKEGIYVGAEIPASRRMVMIYVYEDIGKASVATKSGAARNISVPAWSHGVVFGLGGDVETFGTQSTGIPGGSITETRYSYNHGISVDNLTASSNNANVGSESEKFNNVYANSFVGNATSATNATNITIGGDVSGNYGISLSGTTLTLTKK